jgi:hypothetical protein
MKKLLLTSALALVCAGAFAQGKITFLNDSLHLVYYTTDTKHLVAGDESLAGQATLTTANPSGHSLYAELWGGTSTSTLSKIVTTTFTGSSAAGKWSSVNVSTGYAGGANASVVTPPGGQTDYFQITVYDTLASSYAEASTSQNEYYGETSVFTMVPSTTTSYFYIYNSAATKGASTWANGTYSIPSAGVGYSGGLGAIEVVANVPEPTSFALAGLGAAALLIFRRRK